MKFSCDRCGKKYATADNPAPGRVYKLKCKACGHLIVVKARAPTRPPPRHEPASRERPDEIPLEVGAPEPAGAAALAERGALAVARRDRRHVPMPAALPQEPTPQPADGGYVDLFSDTAPPRCPARARRRTRSSPPPARRCRRRTGRAAPRRPIPSRRCAR